MDPAITLPRTLENVWYRTNAQPPNFVPFEAEGTLMVTSDALLFNGSGGSVTVSVRTIRDINWRSMDGDLLHEWAVIYFVEDGVEKIVGFTAADRYVYHTSNRDLYSAIVKAWRGSGTQAR